MKKKLKVTTWAPVAGGLVLLAVFSLQRRTDKKIVEGIHYHSPGGSPKSFAVLAPSAILLRSPDRPNETKIAQLDEKIVAKTEASLSAWSKLKLSKAVFSADEKKRLVGFVESPSLVRNSLLYLAQIPSGTEANEFNRLKAIDFLASAVASPGNPLRAQAISAISDLVLGNTAAPNAQLNLDQKRNQAGDRIELLAILIRNEPSVADSLEAKASNQQTKDLFTYGRVMYKTGQVAYVTQ